VQSHNKVANKEERYPKFKFYDTVKVKTETDDIYQKGKITKVLPVFEHIGTSIYFSNVK
jgi:hypothetical protein